MEIKQQHILDTGFKLFTTYSVKSVAIDDLVRELAISKRTFYQFYKSKTELLLDVVKKMVDDNQKHLLQIQSLHLPPLLELNSFFEWLTQQIQRITPRFIKDLEKYHPEIYATIKKALHEQFVGFIRNNIAAGQDKKIYRDDVNACMFADVCQLQMETFFRNERVPENTLQDWIQTTHSFLVNAIVLK